MSDVALLDQTLDRAALDALVDQRLAALADATNSALAAQGEQQRAAFVELVQGLNAALDGLVQGFNVRLSALADLVRQGSPGNGGPDPRLEQLERLRVATVGQSAADPLFVQMQKVKQVVRDDNGDIVGIVELGPNAA